MKDALVDVPVVLYLWTRPEKLKKVFSVIREAKPTKLFLISDGAFRNNENDWALIQESRKVIEDIDWKCEVHKLFFEENNGLFKTFKLMSDFVFSKVDRYVFLEDDVVPAISFFKYCEILLERYKDDLRINMISGMNHLGVYEEPTSDYFFARGAVSIWGFAIWKRTYEKFYTFDFTRDNYYFNLLLNNAQKFSGFKKLLKGYKVNEYFEGDLAGPELFLGVSSFLQNQLSIIPRYNMINNIGYGTGGRNFNVKKLLTRNVASLFDMITYEIDFPLKHTDFVIEDKIYCNLVLKKLGVNNPLITKIELIYRQLMYRTLPRLLGIKG